jgi:hypothetical protein
MTELGRVGFPYNPNRDLCKSLVCDPEGIKARSRWLSESASDTTGILKKSACIPEETSAKVVFAASTSRRLASPLAGG